MLERFFALHENGTTVRTELLAGLTTFLTMAYIMFVNPMILADAGMDRGAVFVATCLAAAFGSAMMGLYANYPIALAPGMGLNAYFAYGVVQGMGYTWQIALGAVFLSAILFVILSVLPIREMLVNAIPHSLKMAISAGIGLFLAIIAFKNSGVIIASPATFVTVGDLTKPEPILAAIGFVAIAAMMAARFVPAIIVGVVGVTVAGIALGITPFAGVISAPPSLAPVFLQMDLAGAFQVGLIAIIFAFLFVDLLDNTGTLIGVCYRAGLVGPDGRVTRLKPALLTDSTAAGVGAALGTSTTTSYIESAAGTNVGGRTGLTAVVVAALFLISLFLSPLATTIPAYATAPAILFVGCLMTRGLIDVNWDDVTEYAPAVITAVTMPLTFSIAHGIAFGFISYAAIKLLSGRWTGLHPVVPVLAVLFCIKFAVL